MSTLSALKNSVISAFKGPHDGHKQRSRRRVISFNEALENLKTSRTGFVSCAAFNSFGKCRKEIASLDSDLLTNLDQLDMADVQTPIKLMPLMLCSTHWEKTVYHNALFLDWLSVYGSRQENQHYENIVIDYQSAIEIDNEEHSLSRVSVASKPIAGNQERPASAPNGPTENFNGSHILNSDHPSNVTADQNPTNSPQIKVHNKPSPSDYGPEDTDRSLPEVSVLASMESYASIELGVAKLEIIYQEDLKCIAMTSDGWRCQEIIQKEQLLKAREFLSSSVMCEGELDLELLPGLVLCAGHGLGELPKLYSERWTAFSEQRLSKEEALSKFNAEFWMSVQFFQDAGSGETPPMNMRRPRSASNISTHQREKHNFVRVERAGGDSLRPPPKAPLGSQGHDFPFSLPNNSFMSEYSKTTPKDGGSLESQDISETPSSSHRGTMPITLGATTFRPMEAPRPTPVLESLGNSNNLEDAPTKASGSEPKDIPAVIPGTFNNLGLRDQPPQPEAVISSVPEAAIPQASPLRYQKGAQNSQAGISTTPSVLIHPWNQNKSQIIIDSNLLKEINSTISRGGYVTIFKSHGSFDGKVPEWIKIGKARDIILHKQQRRAGCQLEDFDHVRVDSIYAKYPERVTKLVQLELENFQAKISCLHRHHYEEVEQEHRQWFDVSESVAIKSVQLWCDFVDQAYTSEGALTEHWESMMTSLPKPCFEENLSLETGRVPGYEIYISKHHALRNTRYRKWVQEGLGVN